MPCRVAVCFEREHMFFVDMTKVMPQLPLAAGRNLGSMAVFET